jgi:hypothetical protein
VEGEIDLVGGDARDLHAMLLGEMESSATIWDRVRNVKERSHAATALDRPVWNSYRMAINPR